MSLARHPSHAGSRPAGIRSTRNVIAGGFLLLAAGAASVVPAEGKDDELIASGERLVRMMDCNVCHTPKVMTEQGPRPDGSRLLSGHPAGEALPPVPEGMIAPGGWGGLFTHGLTAWVGPWGVSFGSNLTPDTETGIGGWTEQDFVEAMRGGMPFLPPMPTYAVLTDEELHAMFAYLRSIPPVRNEVPAARPPAGAPGAGPPGH